MATSHLEKIARIIDPSAFDGSIHTKHGIQFSEATVNLFRSDAMAKARAILALPAIVKMQEALEPFSVAFDICEQSLWPDGGDTVLSAQNLSGANIHLLAIDDLRRAREALAALQPLKKEAE